MKKTLVFVIVVFIVLGLELSGRDIYYNYRDRAYWKELSSKLYETQIEEVTLDYKVFLEGDEFKNFVMDLNKAKFYKSNWRKEGPTGPIITIKYKDGSIEHLQYWGKGIYETSYKKGQFLIQNPELDIVLQKYEIDDLY